jgi:hypothetical protein
MKHRSKLSKTIFSLVTTTFAIVALLFINQTHTYAAAEHVWTITLGASDFDLGSSVAVDRSGDIYLTGQFGETVDFDPGPDTDYHTAAGPDNPYLTRFNSDGTYVWTKVIQATDGSVGNGVAVDASGNIYLTGDFTGTADFDPGPGVDSRIASGGNENMPDIFLTKINADGSYAWTKTIGGPDDDEALSVALDSSGNIYIAGFFSGTVDFDPDGSGDSHSSAGSVDIFLTKINLNGSYGWTKTIHGTVDGPFQIVKVALDSGNNIYIAGYFTDTADFDPGPGVDNHTSAGQGDMFLTRINSDGSYGWTKTFGGSSDDGKYSSVAADSSDNVYVVSNFSGTADFDPDPVATDFHTSAGQGDISLTRINTDGSYGWTKIFSGPGDDGGSTSVAVDARDNVYVAGTFSNTVDFDPDPVATDFHTSAGSDDIFITKINADQSYGWTHTIGGTGTDYGLSNTTDRFGNIYVTGAIDRDIFLTKFFDSGSVPPLDFGWAWLWADHRRDVDGKTQYRMIADIGLDTGSVNAYLDLPDRGLNYELDYWGEDPLNPPWHDYGKVFYDPPPGDWWKTTYQFRTDDGLTTPLFSHVTTNFAPMDFVQADIVGKENPTITWDSIANADQYRVRLYDPSDGSLLFSERIDDDGSPSYSYTYSGDLFLQYDYLWVVLEARDYDGDQLLNRSKIYYEHSATPVGEYVITLKLKNVPEELTFYQDHVPDNRLEYSWSVVIDTDGNPNTGDWEGYDVEISISNWKFTGSKPITKSIIDGTQKNTWILSDTGSSYGHPIKAEIDYNTNSIMMIVREDLAELADLDITDRFRFITDYYSPGGPNWDETSENQPGSNIVSDPEGDVGYDFIDILEGKIEYRTPSWSMAYNIIFDNSSNLALFRQYRDEILLSTTKGVISSLTSSAQQSQVHVPSKGSHRAQR